MVLSYRTAGVDIAVGKCTAGNTDIAVHAAGAGNIQVFTQSLPVIFKGIGNRAGCHVQVGVHDLDVATVLGATAGDATALDVQGAAGGHIDITAVGGVVFMVCPTVCDTTAQNGNRTATDVNIAASFITATAGECTAVQFQKAFCCHSCNAATVAGQRRANDLAAANRVSDDQRAVDGKALLSLRRCNGLTVQIQRQCLSSRNADRLCQSDTALRNITSAGSNRLRPLRSCDCRCPKTVAGHPGEHQSKSDGKAQHLFEHFFHVGILQ